MALFRSIGLFAAGLLVATVVAEGGARLIEATPLWRILPVAEVALYGPDSETGYTLRPNVSGVWATENHAQVAINALGLRDAAMTREKPAGTRRVVVVGDSMTEALQVQLEDSFVQVAERSLRDQGHAVEVINLGLSGATPAVNVQRLRHKGLPLSPDIALVTSSAIELSNPRPDDDSAYPGYIADGQGGARIGMAFRDSRGFQLRVGLVGDALYWMLDHFRVARILNARKNAGWLQEWPKTSREAAAPLCAGFHAQRLAQAFTEEGDGFALARVRAFARDLGAVSRQANMPVAVLMRDLGAVCGDNPVMLQRVQERLVALFGEHGVALIDSDAEVAVRLRSGEREEDLHGFTSRIGHGHYNIRGHQVYADVIERAIVDLLKLASHQ